MVEGDDVSLACWSVTWTSFKNVTSNCFSYYIILLQNTLASLLFFFLLMLLFKKNAGLLNERILYNANSIVKKKALVDHTNILGQESCNDVSF